MDAPPRSSRAAATAEARVALSSNGSPRSAPNVDPALSEAVRLVAARVADELSNPLTSLSTRLELMLAEAADGGGPAATVDDLHALHRGARRLIHLVEALRCYSGDGLAGSRPVRLNEIVSRAHASAGVSGVTLALDPGDPLILGDAAPLERFVVRMLAEACRTSRDGPGVRVETRAADGEPHHVVLAISGADGMPDLAESSRHLLAEHSGALDVRPVDDRRTLLLTFPRLTLFLP
jgi:signal transduction histidine kinase